MRRFTLIRGICSLLFCVILQALSAQVQPVQVVETRVLGRSFPGYQVTVRKARPELRQGIQAWLSRLIPITANFEDLVIAEQVNYVPITTAAPITLFYQLEDVESVMTELTVVAIYDQREPIHTQSFPDLSLRLLLDLDAMLQRISGDSLNIDPIFEDLGMQALLDRYAARKAETESRFFVEQGDDEVIERNDLRLEQDPFKGLAPNLFETEDAIVQEISRRFDSYLARMPEPQDAPAAQAQQAEAQYVRTVDSLQNRLALILRHHRRLRLMVEAQGKNADTLEARTLTLQRALENCQVVNAVLSSQINPDSITPVLAETSPQLSADLDLALAEVELSETDWQDPNRRRKVLMRLWENVNQTQNELALRERELAARELRLAQREKYLAEYEESGEARALLKRIADLEAEMSRLKAAQQSDERE